MGYRVVLIIFIWINSAFGADTSICKNIKEGLVDGLEVLLARNIEQDKIEHALRRVPDIKKEILKIWEDTKTPSSLKKIIRKLIDYDIDIHMVPEQSYDKALYLVDKNQVLAFNITPSRNANMDLSSSIAKEKTKIDKFINEVYLKNQDKGVFYNIFLAHENQETLLDRVGLLVHELAHIRMLIFFNRNIARLSGKYPQFITRENPLGKYTIDSDFYHFIQEIYAYQSQHRFLSNSNGKTYNDYSDLLGDQQILHSQKVRVKISRFVIDEYRITNPEVLKIKDSTLHELLN